MAEYADANADRKGLRGLLTNAVEGVKSIFGRTPEQEAADEEKKVLGTWAKEIELAENFFRDYQEDAVRCVHAFVDEHNESLPARPKYKLNLFNSNVTTLTSIMYAKLPKVEADRRFADPNDDVARVASEIVTRILQNDLNDPEDKLAGVLKQALQDRLVAGLGAARVRYCLEENPAKGKEGEEGYEAASKKDEWCDIEYVHWRDVLWSPCRTPAEMRWIAFRVYLTKGEVTARFGKEIADTLPFASRGPTLDPGEGKASEMSGHQDAAQAEVWEIWDKASKRVYWFVKGFTKFLDVKEDPMNLPGFFPNAPSMIANTTTLKLIPKPDYLLSEDLYEEINELEARIAMLTKACKAVGVYPANAKEIGRILTEACENDMVPVENWAMFADKGGLKGQIDYFPIKEVAETIQILVQQQQLRIQQLYQVTGMSDIIRGQASTQGVTATEQRIKAQFASTRMQSFQDEFANFASELLNRKVCLIRKFYDRQRILDLSNILNTPDAQFAEAAIKLIKDDPNFDCRVAIRAESMAQIDYEALKTERSEFLNGVASFLGSAAPLLESMPAAAPFLLELLKFNLAGMKGSKQMEGVFDQAIAAQMKQQQEAAANPQPTPEEKAQQLKNEGAVQVAQAKAQADMAGKQQEAQLEMQKMAQELQQSREEHALKIKEMEAKIALLFQQLQMKREEHALDLQAQQTEQVLDVHAQEQEQAFRAEEMDREATMDEARFEREEEQSERQFHQQERHAEAAAKREARQPKGDE
jgi:hypothetical protein